MSSATTSNRKHAPRDLLARTAALPVYSMSDKRYRPNPFKPEEKPVQRKRQPKMQRGEKPYANLIVEALENLVAPRGGQGISGMRIRSWLKEHYDIDEKALYPHVKMALSRGVKSGRLICMKDNGLRGLYRINKNFSGSGKPASKRPRLPAVTGTLDAPSSEVGAKTVRKKSSKSAPKEKTSQNESTKKVEKPARRTENKKRGVIKKIATGTGTSAKPDSSSNGNKMGRPKRSDATRMSVGTYALGKK